MRYSTDLIVKELFCPDCGGRTLLLDVEPGKSLVEAIKKIPLPSARRPLACGRGAETLVFRH